MPKLKESTRELRRQQILLAAGDCLIEKGLNDTTVADIAARAQLAPASIYNHFPNKQTLIAAVARGAMLERVAEFDRPGVPYPPWELTAHLVRKASTRRPQLGVLLQMVGESSRDEMLRAAIAEAQTEALRPMFYRSVKHWATLKSGATQGTVSADRLTPFLLTLTFGFFAQVTLFRDFDIEEFCTTVEQLIGNTLEMLPDFSVPIVEDQPTT